MPDSALYRVLSYCRLQSVISAAFFTFTAPGNSAASEELSHIMSLPFLARVLSGVFAFSGIYERLSSITMPYSIPAIWTPLESVYCIFPQVSDLQVIEVSLVPVAYLSGFIGKPRGFSKNSNAANLPGVSIEPAQPAAGIGM
jgi:hypothetical protein